MTQEQTKPTFSYLRDRIDIQLRQRWVTESKEQYPSKLVVIVEPNMQELTNESINPIKNPKFLFPKDFNIGQVVCVVRKKIEMTSQESLLMFVNTGKRHILLRPHNQLQDIYDKYKQEDDNMLYLIYAKENVFG